jgi:hypothetical protein
MAWLPLLVLNGVSAASGRRIVTTLIGSNYEPADKCPVEAALKATVDSKQKSPTVQRSAVRTPDVRCLIFLETAWFHRLLSDESEPDWLGRIQRLVHWDYLRERLAFGSTPAALDDVRLSTAAHNSARFPIISPPGAVRNRKHQVVERIVDGGYFENYGALAAMEIAVAIRTVKPELTPFVLVVSNDPDEDPDLTSIDAPDSVTFSDISVPIEAFANTRTARGRLALYHLQSLMDSVTASACGDDTAQIRVWPQYRQTSGAEADKKISRPVSMSWWLSRPIQILLHQQTENAKNDNQNQEHIARVWRALEAISDCKPTRLADTK